MINDEEKIKVEMYMIQELGDITISELSQPELILKHNMFSIFKNRDI